MANKHIKRHSKLLVIKEPQIKMPKRYYLLPIRMTIIPKQTNHRKESQLKDRAGISFEGYVQSHCVLFVAHSNSVL